MNALKSWYLETTGLGKQRFCIFFPVSYSNESLQSICNSSVLFWRNMTGLLSKFKCISLTLWLQGVFVSCFLLTSMNCGFFIPRWNSVRAVSKSSSRHLNQMKFASYLLGTSSTYINNVVDGHWEGRFQGDTFSWERWIPRACPWSRWEQYTGRADFSNFGQSQGTLLLVAVIQCLWHLSTFSYILQQLRISLGMQKNVWSSNKSAGTRKWTSSFRNQLVLKSLILIFHHKEGKNSFKLLLCIIII